MLSHDQNRWTARCDECGAVEHRTGDARGRDAAWRQFTAAGWRTAFRAVSKRFDQFCPACAKAFGQRQRERRDAARQRSLL